MSIVINDVNTDQVIKLRSSGVMPVQIAKILGISVSLVYKRIQASGVKFKNPRFVELSESDKKIIISAYESGIGVSGIPAHTGIKCAPSVIAKFLKPIYGNLRNRSEQQFARMAKSTPEQIAKLTESAHMAARGRVRSVCEKEKRAKTLEGSFNKRSKLERLVFNSIAEFFPNAVPSKAVGVYNLDIGVGNVAVEIFGGGWSYSDKGRVSKYLGRTKKLAELGYNTVFIVFARKSADIFDSDNLIQQIKIASLNPASSCKYRVIWGDFNAASGLCSDINHDAFIPPFINVRDVTTGRYKRVLR